MLHAGRQSYVEPRPESFIGGWFYITANKSLPVASS